MKAETFETNTREKNPQTLIDTFFRTFHDEYSQQDEARIRDAWDFLISRTRDLKRKTGLPYYLHPMRVACILAQSHFDTDCVIAGFFHNILEVEPESLEQIRAQFGESVANVCDGTAKITALKFNTTSLQQSDAIRKMLFALVDDIRVILVKLADRLDSMRNLKTVAHEAQKAIAHEVIEIWAPLAGRLGMKDVKNELEDLSLKYSNPEAFQQIKSIVAQTKAKRREYLDKAVHKIYSASEKAGITVSISSRAKHFYSIYQKMRKRNKEAGDLYDLLALRIICSTVNECYTLIGIVHGLWKPLDGRFKDYIAMPKANGYQSLHTTVLCEGKPLEIQIRTQEMHDVAEHGVASHWLYKKGTNRDMVRAEDLSIINQLRELRDKHLDDEAFFTELKNELLGDRIYVFTPRGDVKELPAGSCAIDFAYAIHSAIGEKIVGAKADGKIIPLTAPLHNTQIVEILTNPQAHPTQNQLKAVKTGKAHQKIHSWLAENDPTFIDKDALAKREAEIAANTQHSKEVAAQRALQGRTRKSRAPSLSYTGKILVEGSSNFVVNIAQCCKPQPGTPIMGYISHKRGLMVHSADCLTYLRIPNIESRSVNVSWATDQKSVTAKAEKEMAASRIQKEKAKEKSAEKNRYRTQR